MVWKIDKTIDFCYGHRVHTQVLNGEYADNLKCACRHMHGHEGKVQIYLESNTLETTGMVTDFRHLEWLKRWIDEYIDHQFIIDAADPLFNTLNYKNLPVQACRLDGYITCYKFIIDSLEPNTPDYEYYEGITIVEFTPTSENLSKWLFDIVQYKMSKIGVTTVQVDWWETPRSRSSYRKD